MRMIRQFCGIFADLWKYQPKWARIIALPLTLFFALLGTFETAMDSSTTTNKEGKEQNETE